MAPSNLQAPFDSLARSTPSSLDCVCSFIHRSLFTKRQSALALPLRVRSANWLSRLPPQLLHHQIQYINIYNCHPPSSFLFNPDRPARTLNQRHSTQASNQQKTNPQIAELDQESHPRFFRPTPNHQLELDRKDLGRKLISKD
ncbi:hypothetical protein PGTUg99_031256 [Puccinia graminis f. sp. tritici]|uniref:Uncharacterized protein n=1 Tax=Puccinia graminis f. sp. tritici TaxID=56615 RepID=A0A5B0RRB1_PUCGR|nr:hypothetical protein PGTUg99_031256 [Puccinia graminis f. sp. tritici]